MQKDNERDSWLVFGYPINITLYNTAGRFIKNFSKFTGNEAGKPLVAAGPKL